MGLPPDHAKHGIDQHWARPFEDIESQGCPCGWDSAFYRSVLKYVRRRTDDGGRVENKLLSLTEDPLVIEAVEALEEYQEQWLNECRRKLHAEYKAKQKARER